MSHASLLVLIALTLTACGVGNDSFLDPGGPVAAAQRDHLFDVVAWTAIAVVPVFVLVPLILWRYRYRNDNARFEPGWEISRSLDLIMWGVPIVIVSVLSVLLWHNTHKLDPYKPIASTNAPLQIQVIGLDWKWLFIYPELGIATVNELALPVGTSVSLDLTSDTVMHSFMISVLAGQIYVMPGMRTKLHVLADELGRYEGENTQFSGSGFTEQKFEVLVMSAAEFPSWVASVRDQGIDLHLQTYYRLAIPSTGTELHDALGSRQMPERVLYFNSVEPDLFSSVLGRYTRGTAVPPAWQPGAVNYIPPADRNGEAQ